MTLYLPRLMRVFNSRTKTKSRRALLPGFRPPRRLLLFVSVDDPAARQIIRRERQRHAIAREHANPKLAHLARNRRQHGMAVFERHAKRGVAQQLRHRSVDL